MPQTDLLRILRRRGWLIPLLIVLTASAAFVFSRLQSPLYRAAVKVSIQPSRPDFGTTQTAKILLGNFADAIYTQQVAQIVIDELQLDMVPDALKAEVTITPDIDRLAILIEVKDPNGDQANRIATAWANQLVALRQVKNQEARKEDRIYAQLLDPPQYERYRPQTTINVAAGAVLGLLLGAGLIFALEWIESGIVRNPADLERLEMTVLGAIPPASAPRTRPDKTTAVGAA